MVVIAGAGARVDMARAGDVVDAVDLRGEMARRGQPAPQATQLTSEVKWQGGTGWKTDPA